MHPDLEGMLEDARSAQRSANLAESARRCREWDAGQARGIPAWFARCAALRALFGEPAVDERPWRGDDFRL